MNTSSEVIKLLEDALAKSRAANAMINDLIAPHDYQDVATLVTQAGTAILEAAVHLMQSKDVAAFDALERAEDLLDAVYAIIDGEIDEE